MKRKRYESPEKGNAEKLSRREGQASSVGGEEARHEKWKDDGILSPAPVWMIHLQSALFSALLFFSMTVQTAWMSIILAVLAVALSIGKGPLCRLRERFCVPLIGFALFGAVCGCAAVYASFGDYAVKEYYKLIAAFSLAVIALSRLDRRHVRGLLWGVAAVCAVISLICTDGASGGPLYEPFLRFVGRFGASYDGVIQNAWGSRVNGIYNDANISAGILALGCLDRKSTRLNSSHMA